MIREAEMRFRVQVQGHGFDKVLAGIRTDFHQPGTKRRPRASQDALVAVLDHLNARAFADMVRVDTTAATKFHERLDDQIH